MLKKSRAEPFLLLKFARDRKNWVNWLWEAKKRYGIQVLNYAVTSNHFYPVECCAIRQPFFKGFHGVNLLVYSDNNREIIPKSIQLVAGKTAQHFNERKKRKGAFWQDRNLKTQRKQGV